MLASLSGPIVGDISRMAILKATNDLRIQSHEYYITPFANTTSNSIKFHLRGSINNNTEARAISNPKSLLDAWVELWRFVNIPPSKRKKLSDNGGEMSISTPLRDPNHNNNIPSG
jgi:hypothetical protein